MGLTSATLVAVIGLVLIHLFSPRIQFPGSKHKRSALSAAGGVSIAYIFIHVLPELQAGQRHVSRAWDGLGWLEYHVYLIALLGLAVFYGLDKLARSKIHRRHHQTGEGGAGRRVCWVHINSFAAYNALIGYLLLHREQSLSGLIAFSIAMGLHFVVTDHGLYEHHEDTYERAGRYVIAAALVLGWLLSLLITASASVVSALFAFLAGGVILNVLKGEVPEERESRYGAFVFGMIAYSALLLAI